MVQYIHRKGREKELKLNYYFEIWNKKYVYLHKSKDNDQIFKN